MCLGREAEQIKSISSCLVPVIAGNLARGHMELLACLQTCLSVWLSLPLNVLLCAGCCAAQSVPHYLNSLPLGFVFAVAEWQRAAEPLPSNLL